MDEALTRALALGDEGDWDGMADALEALLEAHPDDATVLCWLGVAEQGRGRDGVAYERFRQAMEGEPEDPYVLATIGAGLARLDDPEAEGLLRTAALTGPEVAYARTMYGAYLSREGQIDVALQELDAAVGLAPDDPDVHVERGVALALGGRLEEAVDAFQQALTLDPDESWAQALLGLALVELGRLEDALADLVPAALARPEDVELQVVAALAAAAAEDEARAFELLERARLRAAQGDLPLVSAAEDRIDEGGEAARSFLEEELASSQLRERLAERP
ncbi:MAG: tetratricopeptide repeat protein [Gemmatimonadetes bacterium]|nr:MAG: tetratricopeptide repeat protein [Gemmatimonadota bacterium]